MHQEFAVEPEAIGSSWNDFRFLIEYFGYSRGRLISRFPKRWERQVIEAAKAAGVRDVECSRIIERLNIRKSDVLMKSGREYEPDKSWVENAVSSHQQKPFHALLVENADLSGICTCIRDADETNPLMGSPISAEVKRTPDDIASCCRLLTGQANIIDIVDPFFDIRGAREGGRPRSGDDFKGTLLKIIANCESDGNRGKLIRIHYREHDQRPPQDVILNGAKDWISETIPSGFEIQLIGWKELEDGEDIHDRFLLTPLGGLKIGAGFGATVKKQHANVVRLDGIHVASLLNKYDLNNTVYERVGFVVSICSDEVKAIDKSHRK